MPYKDKEHGKEMRIKYYQEHKDAINARRRASSSRRRYTAKYRLENYDRIYQMTRCECGGHY